MRGLHNLKPAAGSNKARKRLGRGIGSGLGKTAGKGHKGQIARAGGKIRPGFEGGQMPLYRRLPKRGFNNPNKIVPQVINLSKLEAFGAGEVVDHDSLVLKGFIKSGQAFKILARGEIKSALVVRVAGISQAARQAIEKAGGKVEGV